MSDEAKLAFSKYNNALLSLDIGVKNANDDLGKDGVIQRFEFTFELLWKFLKIYLFEDGIDCRSPKDCLGKAFKYGLIHDEQIFLNMLIDRNNSTHIYSKEDSEEIYQRIKNDYVHELKKIYKELEDKI